MKVFIENEADSYTKNIFDEKTLEYQTSKQVSSPYPFPYGFILNTTSGDGDNVDCFVITDAPLKSMQIVEINVLGLLEMREDNELDHKIIACLKDEPRDFTKTHHNTIEGFIHKVFSHIPNKKIEVGRLLDAGKAMGFIKESQDRL